MARLVGRCLMTPLTRVVLLNLAWRFGVQVPVFVTYRILSGGSR